MTGGGRAVTVVAMAAVVAAGACAVGGPPDGRDVEITVPEGAGARTVARRLQAAGLVDHPRLFALYVRLRGTAGSLKAGRYRFETGASWPDLARALERGTVATVAVTVPEGLTLEEVARRLEPVTSAGADSLIRLAKDSAFARSLGVPGPTLEGYLFPETYRFAEGIAPEAALRTLVDRYRRFWGPAQRSKADSAGLDELEVVTLASIVEEEARVEEERPIIAGVYLNRLERGMRLQADPTVQYALEEPKERLLYRDIRRVADDPYNTYTHAGLPPGPISSPGAASLRAVLDPADVPYLFFVARPDGSHVFTRTQSEHVEAKNRLRRERESAGDAGSG
jgi:UPF0755 protein